MRPAGDFEDIAAFVERMEAGVRIGLKRPAIQLQMSLWVLAAAVGRVGEPDGGRLRELGEDVAEMLEYVRACFKLIRHVRPKLSCDGCDHIVQALAPSRPIDRGLAGPGLLAHVLVAKYADSLPVYRQSEIYSREGVDLDRSTLAGWVGATADLLAPLVEAVRGHVMAATKLHADDTPVPVLAPGNGRTKTGRLWTYVGNWQAAGGGTFGGRGGICQSGLLTRKLTGLQRSGSAELRTR